MGHGLIDKISAYLASHPSLQPFQTVSMADVKNAEQRLGFQLPELLRAFYTTIGNGYRGSSCDIIGLSGGNCSGFGNLVETYLILKEGQESEGGCGRMVFCHSVIGDAILFPALIAPIPDIAYLSLKIFNSNPRTIHLNSFLNGGVRGSIFFHSGKWILKQ